jgi:sugar phosphate isomerase/epimerase
VEVACLALSNDFTHKPDLTVEVSKAARLLQMAKVLRAPLVRVNPGMKGDGPDEEQIQTVAEGIRQVLPVAEQLGLLLALENHQLFGLKYANILKVLDRLEYPPGLGVCLDLGNFFHEDLHTGPSQLAPYAIHVHAKSFRFDANGGETSINYPERLRELRHARYTGFVTIEYEGSAGEDEIGNTRKTIRLVQGCLSNLETVAIPATGPNVPPPPR